MGTTLKSLSAAQTYQGLYVNTFNFTPSDFNFYQKKPIWMKSDNLSNNHLRGSFEFNDYHTYVEKTSVNINNGSALDKLTIELWVKADQNINSSYITLFNYSDTNNTYLRLQNPANLLVNYYYGSFNTNISILDGLWHHIAIVLENGKPIITYVDARPVNVGTAYTYSHPYTDSGTFLLGNESAGNSSYWFQKGMAGQVRIWNDTRTLTEIIYNAGRYLLPGEMQNLSLYWSNQYDVASSIIKDSSGNNNDGTVSHDQNEVWNVTEAYGAIFDPKHRLPQAENMVGNIVFDGSRIQEVYKSKVNYPNNTPPDSLTVEFWVKVASACSDTAVLFDLYDPSGGGEDIQINNPNQLTIHLDDLGDISTSINLKDGRWHHIALVWQLGTSLLLYVDTISVSLGSTHKLTKPLALNSTIDIAGYNDRSYNAAKFLTGSMSEIRVWNTARSQEEIVRDASYRLYIPPEELFLYWPFARQPTHHTAEDFSIYDNNGYILHGPVWEDTELFGVLSNHIVAAPTPDPSNTSGSPSAAFGLGNILVETIVAAAGDSFPGATDGFPNVTKEQLEQAFTNAQNTGYFDRIIFPNIINVSSVEERDTAKAVIAHLEFDEFLMEWISDRRLNLVMDKKNQLIDYEFIKKPQGVGPTLFLMYTIQLSSFYGELGEGQIVRTFSLMPGESTTVSIETYKNSTRSANKASSILDSNSFVSQHSFRTSINNEKGAKAGAEIGFDFYADVKVKERWGFGNANVDTGVKAKGGANIEGFMNQTSNAMHDQAVEASSNRNVEINTNYTVQTESGKQTAITREFRNINNSKTMNLLFSQLNQEFALAYHLIDVHVGYYDPEPGSFRTVNLYEVDDLLDQVLVDDADNKLAYKQNIVEEVIRNTNSSQFTPNGNIIIAKNKNTGDPVTIDYSNPLITADNFYFFNKNAYCTIDVGDDKNIEVKGLIYTTDEIVMRTDNVVADVILGEGEGLDQYAQDLQTQTVRRETVNNDKINVENQKLAAGLKILQAAEKANASPETLADMYKEMFVRPVQPATAVVVKDEEPKSA